MKVELMVRADGNGLILSSSINASSVGETIHEATLNFHQQSLLLLRVIQWIVLLILKTYLTVTLIICWPEITKSAGDNSRS